MISLIEFITISGLATLTAAGVSQGLNLLRQPRGGRSGPLAQSDNGEAPGRPSAGAWHEPRYGKRHRISGGIQYAVGEGRLQGMLVDISRQGWRVRATQPVARGTTMTANVYFPDLSYPIIVDEAIVRWADSETKPSSAAVLTLLFT